MVGGPILYTVGIDIGSTHIKACLLGERKDILSQVNVEHEKVEYANQGSVYDCENLWDKVTFCLKSVLTGIDTTSVKAIGITSMAEAGVPIGYDGKALYHIIPWSDNSSYAEEFPKHLQGYPLYQKTGLLWHPKYTINRLLFLRKEKSEIFNQMKCWLSVSDYVLFCLTGEMKTDPSLASRTMLYNIISREWDRELLEFAQMEGKLPEVMNKGAARPVILPHIANKFGLPYDVIVNCGGHDHLLAAKAEEIEIGKQILNSMGTSEVFIGLLNKPLLTKECYELGISQGCFEDVYYWMCNMPTSGASIEWIRSVLSIQEKIDYSLFLRPAKQLPSKVLYFPFLNSGGTHRRHTVLEGAFLGLSSKTGREDLIQGIYEGIALEIRFILETIMKSEMVNSIEIISVGGGTKNTVLMQTKANVTGISYWVSKQTQATVMGAAITAMEAVGYQGVKYSKKRLEIRPMVKYKEAYDEKYNRYNAYYERLWNEGME